MTILETVLIFVVVPLVITGVIAGLSLLLGTKTPGPVPPEFHLGERWTYKPVLWSAVDEVIVHGHHGGAHHSSDAAPADLIGGSASGKW